jgi:chromate transporter
MNEPVDDRSGSINEAARSRPSLATIFVTFLTAGAISFGGGVVAYLRQYLVEQHGWVDDDGFLDALELSETLPGLNSVNLSVIVGDRLRGIAGAGIAVAGLVLPGIIVVMTLGILWDQNRHNHLINLFLVGVAATAVGLLATVTLQLGHKQLARIADLIFVLVTFAAVSIFKVSLVVVLIVVGGAAIFYYRPREHPRHDPIRFMHLRDRFRSRRAYWRH